MRAEETTRERIRREAAALFRRKGFNGTSMAELAANVGVTKSSLYHHFPSKQALLSEIIELTVDRVTPLVEKVAASDRPASERLRAAVEIHTVEAIRDRDAVACFIEEGRYLRPDLMEAHLAKRDRYEQIFRRMFDEGVEAGEFAAQDVGLSVRAILGMANSVVRWYRPEGPRTPEEIAAHIANFAIGGAVAGRMPLDLVETRP
jgi:AcrR family transcriptional regulator